MDDYTREFDAMAMARFESRLAFGVTNPNAHMKITGLGTTKSPRELLEELRETHPEEAMMLGEYFVLDDDGNFTQ